MSRVHLSFDNGPHPVGTPLVLDVLARHGAKATFFVLGRHLATEQGRALAARIVAEGHRLGNHSWSHETPLGEDPRPDAVDRELGDTQALLDPLWSGPRWFRPFGGGGHLGPHLLSGATVRWMAENRATAVLWNSVPRDWEDPEGWVERALADVERLPHTLIVLHDIVPEAMAGLDRFLTELRALGHTLSDDLPADCLPIVDGAPQPGLDRYVTAAPAA